MAKFVTARILGNTCIFMDNDDNIVLTIKAGDVLEAVYKSWRVTTVPDKKNPKKQAFKLVNCDNDNIYCYIANNKFGYLDLGADLPFLKSKNELEYFLMQRGIFKHIQYLNYESLQCFSTVGGTIKIGRKNYDLLSVITDGQVEQVNNEIPLASLKIDNATYVVELVRDEKGIWPTRIIVKWAEDYSKVVNSLKLKEIGSYKT